MEDISEIHSETEVSEIFNSFSDDSESDSDFDITEETYRDFSNLSIEKNKKTKACKFYDIPPKKLNLEEQNSEICFDENDEQNFEKVQKIIQGRELEKLKIPECKLYLRKNGLRLTGNKDTLIQRIKEHLEIINGGGERKYPRSSFVLNCKGDACTGDVVLFEQNVYEMFSIVSRSASGPPCGKRVVAGRIVKESYGAAKQQHTFTIEVLWSKGEKPLPPLYPLLIKGRNLYKLKTSRQRWEDEGKRQKVLMEKHSRGNVARTSREVRMQEKEKRKALRERRASQKELSSNQSQTQPLRTKSQCQHEKSRSINQGKPELFGEQGRSVATRPQKPCNARPNRVAKWSYQHEESKCINPAKPEFFSDQGRRVATRPQQPQHFEEKLKTIENYPCNAMPNRVAEWSAKPKFFFDQGKRVATRPQQPQHFRENYHCNAMPPNLAAEWSYQHQESRGINPAKPEFFYDQGGVSVSARPPHFKENLISENHPCNAMTNRFDERPNHRKPLTSTKYLFPLPVNKESFKQKQPCKYYEQGRCRFGDNCKFVHVRS